MQFYCHMDELEGIMLGEISQKERDMGRMFSLMCGIKRNMVRKTQMANENRTGELVLKDELFGDMRRRGRDFAYR